MTTATKTKGVRQEVEKIVLSTSVCPPAVRMFVVTAEREGDAVIVRTLPVVAIRSRVLEHYSAWVQPGKVISRPDNVFDRRGWEDEGWTHARAEEVHPVVIEPDSAEDVVVFDRSIDGGDAVRFVAATWDPAEDGVRLGEIEAELRGRVAGLSEE